jgi:hypothetical protein
MGPVDVFLLVLLLNGGISPPPPRPSEQTSQTPQIGMTELPTQQKQNGRFCFLFFGFLKIFICAFQQK